MGFAIALMIVGAGGLGLAYLATPLLRARRALKRTIRRIRGVGRAAERALAGPTRRLEKAARHYAEHEKAARRKQVPLESLKDAGAKNVQWSAFERAGIDTLEDVHGLAPAQLEVIHGVGPASAERVAEAAVVFARRVEHEPVKLPSADLPDEPSQIVATAALDALDAHDVMGAAPRELEAQAEKLAAQVGRIDEKTGFFRWLFSDQTTGHLAPEVHEATAIRRKVEAALDGGLLEDVEARRQRLLQQPQMHRGSAALREDFRARYADACALIESALPQPAAPLGEVPGAYHPLARRLPLEIAEAVEAFPLRVDGLGVTLRRYQAFGAKYLLHQRRTVLGDEMGLGKTIEALAAIVHRRESDGARHFLVVAPASIVRNWGREVENRTELPHHLLAGADRSDETQTWLREGGVAIVSYSTLRRMAMTTALEEAGARLGFLVVDEAHYVKNPEASRTQAVARLLPFAEHATFLSGTPMENHPREFCHLVGMLRADVADQLQRGGAFAGDVVVEPQRFHRLVAPVYLRRNQADVLRELPPKVEFEDWVEVPAAQLAAYRDAVAARNLMAMRRSVTVSTDGVPSAKMERLAEILEEHRESGRKVLVFSFFLPVLEEVARRFGALGQVTGAISGADRMALIDRFQDAAGHALLALQIQAGGVGVNLHAASVVVLMEPQWKPSTEEQAIARAHRMGRTETVLVHRLLARDTVDERLVQVLEGKLELFQAYARDSLIKRVSREATEAAMADLVLAYELERLREAG